MPRKTPDLRLEPFTEDHVPGFLLLLEDPEVKRFTRVPVPVPPGFHRTWLDSYKEGRREGTREAFAVMEGEEFVGIGVAPRIDREGRTVELGYVVGPAARGRGVATRTLSLLTDWAFETLGALRLELIISVENGASKRVAAGCGYRLEGVLRSHHFKQGIREDVEIWSKLPEDP